jgi:hypothetical protein
LKGVDFVDVNIKIHGSNMKIAVTNIIKRMVVCRAMMVDMDERLISTPVSERSNYESKNI